MISIHALHEESDWNFQYERRFLIISIHALHEESDQHATQHVAQIIISIHALHEESDVVFIDCVRRIINFNPRSP